jgi:histone H1/5
VVWGSQGASEEPDDATDVSETRPGEVDLDAPKAAAPKAAAPKAAAPKAAPEKVAAEKAQAVDAPVAEAEASATEPPPVKSRAEPPLAAEMRAAVKSKQKVVTPKKVSAKPKKAASKESAPAASTYSGPNPCKAERFSVPRVRDACAAGGRSAAKAVMKDAIGKALAGGGTLKCADCHAEQRDYTLKPDAVAQLQQWLAR